MSLNLVMFTIGSTSSVTVGMTLSLTHIVPFCELADLGIHPTLETQGHVARVCFVSQTEAKYLLKVCQLGFGSQVPTSNAHHSLCDFVLCCLGST